MAQRGGAAMVDELAHHKMQLQVGYRFCRVAPDEAAGLGEIAGQHAAARLAPLKNALEHAQHAARRDTKQVLAAGCIHHLHHVNVVMQMLAHARQVVDRRNLLRQQVLARANAREHQ